MTVHPQREGLICMTHNRSQLLRVRAKFDLAGQKEVSTRMQCENTDLGCLLNGEPQPLPYIVPVDRFAGTSCEDEWMVMRCQPGLQHCRSAIWYVDAAVAMPGLWGT